MKIGLFTATFLDKKLEEVCAMAASLGYQAIEMPAFAGKAMVGDWRVAKSVHTLALGHGICTVT